MADVVVNQSEMRRLLDGPGVLAGLERVGEQVAQRAAAAAPRATGAGAASIHAEVAEDSRGKHVRVGWGAEHFYLLFHEVGTSRMSARPFLRPALDGNYNA